MALWAVLARSVGLIMFIDLCYCHTLGNRSYDDTLFDHLSVGVSEAIAWYRGRYAHVLDSNIDSVCICILSDCLVACQSDTLTDGQFFDALRMGMHAEAGSGVDRCLDFMQRYVCIFVLLGAGHRSDAGIVVSSDSHT
jgi:hypothetical protein